MASPLAVYGGIMLLPESSNYTDLRNLYFFGFDSIAGLSTVMFSLSLSVNDEIHAGWSHSI